jgi:hypothetical protein
MNATKEEERLERWRVLVLRPAEDRVLLRPEGPAFALPQIAIPAGQRIAANINRVVERDFGIPIVSLYEIFPKGQEPQNEPFYHAAVAIGHHERVPAGSYWTVISSLKADSFTREGEFAAVTALGSLLAAQRKGESTEPFLKPTWFPDVARWIMHSLRARGTRLSGQFLQLNASSTFSLIRFETDRRPVWFKAVGEPNTREFHLTLALARLSPEYLPKLLAVKTEWNAWLAEQASGCALSASADLQNWETVADSLSHLQTLTIPAITDISQAGARNLNPASLLPRVAPFCEWMSDLGDRCASDDAVLVRDLDWRQLEESVSDALTQLGSLNLPETVGHMDLSPQNIFVSSGGCTFLDWAEGFTGCPFFSFEYLLQHFRRSQQRDASMEARFREAYLRRWRQLVSTHALEKALHFCPLAALFAYASTLVSAITKQNSMTAAQEIYLLRLARKMSRMTLQAKGAGA